MPKSSGRRAANPSAIEPPEGAADHVRWREVERTDQIRKIVFVVAARPGFGAVLTAAVPAPVVADHAEAAREILLDGRPNLPVVPTPVDEHEGIPAARLLREQPYPVDLDERHRDSLTLQRNDPPVRLLVPP